MMDVHLSIVKPILLLTGNEEQCCKTLPVCYDDNNNKLGYMIVHGTSHFCRAVHLSHFCRTFYVEVDIFFIVICPESV